MKWIFQSVWKNQVIELKFLERVVRSLRPRDSLVERARDDDSFVIMDVGCRWGFADRFVTKEGRSRKIYGFDPDAAECDRLESLYAKAGCGGIKVLPVALGRKREARTLFLTHEPACSSLYQPNAFLTDRYPALRCAKLEETKNVEVVDMASWARSEGLRYVDYVKIDTQGSELDIILGGNKFIDSARCIDVEVEFNTIYEGQPLFHLLDGEMRKRGFVLWKLSNLVHYSLGAGARDQTSTDAVCYDDDHRVEHAVYGGQLFWADACYIKKEVLELNGSRPDSLARDMELFELLDMPDVVLHLSRLNGVAIS